MNWTSLWIVLGVAAVVALIVALLLRVTAADRPALEVGSWGVGILGGALSIITFVSMPSAVVGSDEDLGAESSTVSSKGDDARSSGDGTDADEEADPTYSEELSEVPFTIRNANDGGSCSPYRAIDFDGGAGDPDFPIVRVVEDESDLSTEQPDAIDAEYHTCADGELVAAQTASVGLLREGAGAGWEECSTAASSTSIGTLNLSDRPEDVGFEPGSALCAVTDQHRVARAAIINVVYNSGIADSIPTVECELTTWVQD